MKKFIIPVICVIVLGCLAGVIVYMNYRSNLFTLPGREAMETEIKKLGYDVELTYIKREDNCWHSIIKKSIRNSLFDVVSFSENDAKDKSNFLF